VKTDIVFVVCWRMVIGICRVFAGRVPPTCESHGIAKQAQRSMLIIFPIPCILSCHRIYDNPFCSWFWLCHASISRWHRLVPLFPKMSDQQFFRSGHEMDLKFFENVHFIMGLSFLETKWASVAFVSKFWVHQRQTETATEFLRMLDQNVSCFMRVELWVLTVRRSVDPSDPFFYRSVSRSSGSIYLFVNSSIRLITSSIH
jgi:hypothetical protein